MRGRVRLQPGNNLLKGLGREVTPADEELRSAGQQRHGFEVPLQVVF